MPFAIELSGLLGVVIVLIGAWGVLAPARITDLVNRFDSKTGMWFASIIRLVLGVALWFAAPQSRAPVLLQVLGIIAVVAAVVIPLMGAERFKGLMEWWGKLSLGAQRLWSVFAVGFGAVILWALLPAAS